MIEDLDGRSEDNVNSRQVPMKHYLSNSVTGAKEEELDIIFHYWQLRSESLYSDYFDAVYVFCNKTRCSQTLVETVYYVLCM